MYTVSKMEGLFNLYVQALEGDKVDNIMYYLDESTGTWKKDYGLGKKGAREALKDCTTEKELYRMCLYLYTSSDKFIQKGTGEQCTSDDLTSNMYLLYMKRTEMDYWEIPE